MSKFLRIVTTMAVAALAAPASGQQAPRIAAAADLKFALEEVSAEFRRETGVEAKLTFGSSGNFFQQIRQGAPFDVFMSADESFVFKLANAGKTVDRGVLYAVGRIVLIAPHGSPLKTDPQLEGLRAALREGRIRRFAIANPEHAPYGQRAAEALMHAGLWDAVRPKLVFGENVQQTAIYATSGSAEGGIIAYSLALSPEVSKLGTFALIPESWHEPLRQRMVLLKDGSASARKFYDFVQGPRARQILKHYGFVLPGEAQ